MIIHIYIYAYKFKNYVYNYIQRYNKIFDTKCFQLDIDTYIQFNRINKNNNIDVCIKTYHIEYIYI